MIGRKNVLNEAANNLRRFTEINKPEKLLLIS